MFSLERINWEKEPMGESFSYEDKIYISYLLCSQFSRLCIPRSVFKGADKETGEIVALKRINTEQEENGFPLTAIREVKILKALEHENIVKLKEIVTSKGTFLLLFGHLLWGQWLWKRQHECKKENGCKFEKLG